MPSPVYRAMRTGALVRIEELTRMPSEVQDALVTILSEKVLPIPELDTEVAAVQGFNLIATANDRDRGINELSSAPAAAVQHRRAAAAGHAGGGDGHRRPARRRARRGARPARRPGSRRRDPPRRDDLPRAARGRHRRRPHEPEAADRHAVDGRGHLGGHQRPGPRRPLRRRHAAGRPTSPAASSARSSRDPLHDDVAWREYLEGVVRDRDGWGDFYDACRELG